MTVPIGGTSFEAFSNLMVPLHLLFLLSSLTPSRSSLITWNRGDKVSRNNASTDTALCRSSEGYTALADFYRSSCARCYAYIFPDHELKVYGNSLIHVDDSKNLFLYDADADDPNSKVLHYFKNNRERHDWIECCRAARSCCDTISNPISPSTLNPATQSGIKTCPAVWDGWQCWPESKADQIISKQCPPYILAGTVPLSTNARVTKKCQANGSWYQVYDPSSNRFKEWSNYTQCLKIDHFYRRQYVRIGAYVVSMVSIIPALVIFVVYKQLKCTRVMLHQNLLIALLMKGVTVVIFDCLFTSSTYSLDGYSKFSPILCNYLAVLNKYLLVATYCWMFNEGFYLHNILIYALKTKDSLKMYYMFGWGFPFIPLIIYVSLKRSQEIFNCWIMAASIMDWVINSVCIFILLVNVIFLIRIVAIIVSKLKTDVQQEHMWHRQTLKAVIFLAPLFGVQIILTLYRPQLANGFLEIYHILNSLIEGLQGFCVALIFCYFNGEVLNKIKATKRKSQSQYLQMYSHRHENYSTNTSKIHENVPLN